MEESSFQAQPVESETQPTKPWLKIVGFSLLGLLLAVALVWAGYWWGKMSNLKTQTRLPSGQVSKPPTVFQPTPTPTPTSPVEDETKDWHLFKSEAHNFEFKHPNNYFIRGKPETYEVLTEKFPLIPFVWVLKESYREMGQAPGITLNFVYTAKDTEVFIRDRQEEALKSWREFKAESGTYQDAPEPKIISITDYQNETLKTKKVERVGPPNAPNQNFTEFYFKHNGLIYALSADSELEVETLSGILSTFKFL